MITSLFNALLPVQHVFILSLVWFAGFFTLRQLYIRRSFLTWLYYALCAAILCIAALAGGGVQNDAYKRLGKFILLEQQGMLHDAQSHPEQYDGMFQIDLKQFKNSTEFADYLAGYDAGVDRAEAASLGWLYAVIAELSLALVCLLRWLRAWIKKKSTSEPV